VNPRDRGGAPTPRERQPPHRRYPNYDQQPQDNAAPRHVGRFAGAWREGFGHGFRDALRLAGRRLPPEMWLVIEALSDEFDLAAGND
jgi:hypothetical protein